MNLFTNGLVFNKNKSCVMTQHVDTTYFKFWNNLSLRQNLASNDCELPKDGQGYRETNSEIDPRPAGRIPGENQESPASSKC